MISCTGQVWITALSTAPGNGVAWVVASDSNRNEAAQSIVAAVR